MSAGMNGYLGSLYEDFDSLGLLNDTALNPNRVELWSWAEAGHLLGYTAGIAPGALAASGVLPPMKTDLGQKALDLMRNPDTPAFRTANLAGCSDAETKLVYNLAPESRPPVIITEGGEPVAVVKTKGERSCYALEDNLVFGLIKGTFAEPANHRRFDDLPASDRVWQMELSELGPVRPMRFSGFMLPEEQRAVLATRAIDDYDRYQFDFSHEIIVKVAGEMLAEARTLTSTIYSLGGGRRLLGHRP